MNLQKAVLFGLVPALFCLGIFAITPRIFAEVSSLQSLYVPKNVLKTSLPKTSADLIEPQLVKPNTAFSTLSTPRSDHSVSHVTYTITEKQATNDQVFFLSSQPSQQFSQQISSPEEVAEVAVIQNTDQQSFGLDAEKIFTMVNQYRVSKNLPALHKDERLCSLAAARAVEIAQEIATNTMHSGLSKHNPPHKNGENIITMKSEEEAVTWWVNDYIHRVTIEGSWTHSCVSCSGNECAQEFSISEE